MIHRIVFLDSNIETLNHFSQELSYCFEEMGYEIYRYTIGSFEITRRKELQLFLDKGESALITFNYVGLSGENNFFQENQQSLWEDKGVRIMQFLVDHPLYYTKQLARNISNMHIYCIDRNHMHYLRKYYEDKEVSFLPLAGNEIVDVMEQKSLQRNQEHQSIEETIPISRRKYDVVFAGNCALLPPFYEKIGNLDAEYRKFYADIYEKSIENSQIPIEDLLEEALDKEMPDIKREERIQAMESLLFLDIYRRDFIRRNVIKTIGEAGINLHLVGKDWESLKLNSYKNVTTTLGMVSSGECIKILRNSKISLNIMPGFLDGSHDRIFSSMLAGCFVLTDESKFLSRICKHEQELAYYQVDELEKLPNLFEKYIQNTDDIAQIATCGYNFAKRFHTWQNRADKIKEFLQ